MKRCINCGGDYQAGQWDRHAARCPARGGPRTLPLESLPPHELAMRIRKLERQLSLTQEQVEKLRAQIDGRK